MADFEFTITESNSMVDLEEYLKYLIIERCNEIYYKIILQDAEYQISKARSRVVLRNSCRHSRNRLKKKL